MRVFSSRVRVLCFVVSVWMLVCCVRVLCSRVRVLTFVSVLRLVCCVRVFWCVRRVEVVVDSVGETGSAFVVVDEPVGDDSGTVRELVTLEANSESDGFTGPAELIETLADTLAEAEGMPESEALAVITPL